MEKQLEEQTKKAKQFKKEICAIVSCDAKHDLALPELKEITAPTLLLIDGRDAKTNQFNQALISHLPKGEIVTIPSALFDEAEALEQICDKTLQWFKEHLVTPLENFERTDYNSFNF